MTSTKDVKQQYETYPFPNDEPKSLEELNIHSWILNSLPGMKIKPNIADVGCGTGEISLFLSQYGKVTGYDISEESLRIARENAIRLKRDVYYYNMDITKNYDTLINYDYIFCIGVLHHIPDIHSAIENLKKMMEHDTILVISLYNKYSWFFRNKIKRKIKDDPIETGIGRMIDDDEHVYEMRYTHREALELFKKHNLKVIGEWRKMPDFIRAITGKGCMMTFSLIKDGS